MFFSIYDDYRGEPRYKPKSGVVLVKESPLDYKYLVKLKQIIDHYRLPVEIDSIDRYSSNEELLNHQSGQPVFQLKNLKNF